MKSGPNGSDFERLRNRAATSGFPFEWTWLRGSVSNALLCRVGVDVLAGIRIKLKSFTVPNFVIAVGVPREPQEGWQEEPKFPLSELEPEVLAEMCDDFRRAVFEKAGKADPTA